ncbi:Bax inhibitor-1/YccA family protein [soil metagenome]
MQQEISSTDIAVVQEQQRFMVKVYGWMTFALMTTGIVAMWVAESETILQFVFGNKFVFYGLLIAQLVMVISMVGFVQKLSASLATLLFVVYAALTRVTFSFIFLIYTSDSIAITFFITAGTFAVMSFYGYFTGTDLTRFGNIMLMGLVGLIIASVVNIFMKSEALQWITTYAGILIFTGLIAYDTQKIKNMNIIGNEGTAEDKKEAIVGALILYLDFINLFLKLLRLFGKRK